MRIRPIFGLLILAGSPLRAEVEVRVAGERVSVRAVSAPISEVLDNLARQTGMRVVYDAPPPRQALTATLENRAPAEVVLAVLEGLGLNYALVMDHSGARVDQLLILGALSTAPAPSRPAAPSVPVQRPAPVQDQNPYAELGLDVPEEEDEADEDPLAQLEAEAGEAPPPAPTPADRPAPPQYPSSSFTPRLPLPTPAPAPSPQATPAPPRNQ